MASRYYVADVRVPLIRWTQIVDGLKPVPGRREYPYELMHWRESTDGEQRLFQAETNDQEHAYLDGLMWVTYLGPYDEATGTADPNVFAFMAADPALWDEPI